jgi:putative membrane protein
VSPAVIGLIVLAATRKAFPLTALTYGLILVHCIILMVGGHYTYALVPFFDTFGGLLEAGRNNYDKLGHFAQGFVPAIIAREILIRKAVVNGSTWRNVFIVSVCLAISACYELVEWCVALLAGISAESFLGTQGYVWDTQSDMLLALLGAVSALVLLGRVHDRQLVRLQATAAS